MGASQSSVLDVDQNTQLTFIDLPGEPVRCIRSKPKLRVVMRKHRDVLFDINIGDGGRYTVESDKSYFYLERDKKLVRFKSPVRFRDGELCHLWVSRNFNGHLLLKRDGKLVAAYEPNVLDPYTCKSQDPVDKPAPLIVTMRPPGGDGAGGLDLEGADVQTMHVVEVKKTLTDVPKQILDFFASGGEETAIDTNGVVTRNWLLGQLVGTTLNLAEQREWIRELKGQTFYLKKRIRKSGEVVYDVVFSGNHKIRTLLKGTRYLADNPAVLSITHGAGTAKGVRHAAWNATKGMVGRLGVIGLLFTIGTDVAEWMQDYDQIDPVTGKPKATLSDLFVKIGINVAKAVVVTAMTAVTMAGLTMVVGAGTFAAMPVVAVVVGVVVIGVLFSYLAEVLDKQLGITDEIQDAAKDVVDRVEMTKNKRIRFDNVLRQNQSETLRYIENKYKKDYQDFSRLLYGNFDLSVMP